MLLWKVQLRSYSRFLQGQSPAGFREYFYYIDHHGQLFLDDMKMKNFVTCFKDQNFLVFFFSRLRANRSGRYEQEFPFVSPCGRERNYVRCEDRPVVFTQLLPGRLSYCGGADRLCVPFRPQDLYVHPATGRLYHPGPPAPGGAGLIGSALAFQLSSAFLYQGGAVQPTHFLWEGQKLPLTNELAEEVGGDL